MGLTSQRRLKSRIELNLLTEIGKIVLNSTNQNAGFNLNSYKPDTQSVSFRLVDSCNLEH